MPKWAQLFLSFVLNAGAVYVGAKFPDYLPILAAAAGALGIPLTWHAINTDPKKP